MAKVQKPSGEQELEATELDGSRLVRDQHGDWRYEDTGIMVPGARDVTLTERFQPKVIVSANQEVERVVVSGAVVNDFPELLGWCLEAGTPIYEGSRLIEVLVPFGLWEEHDRIPKELISPEHHGTEAERELAKAERKVREAELQLDEAADARAVVLKRWSDWMTRQQAREITGLSVGRIQQLIRDERLENLDQPVLALFEEGPIENMKELMKIAGENDLPNDLVILSSVVRELKENRLLREIKGDALALTEKGEKFLRRANAKTIEGVRED